MIRRFGLIGVLALSMLVVSAPSSLAAFPARSGSVAYQEDDINPDTGMTELSAISSIPRDSSANCADTSPAGDQGAPCAIGRFGYSPDGKRIVAERSGRLEVLDANGQNVRILPALTSQDSEPAFLRGGSTIVFTGVAKGAANLYTVNPDGTGLEQLTTKGGSWPAPCANGSIAFINHGALYLRRANGGGLRRVARHASTPDCAPNSKSILFEGPGSSKRVLAGDFIVNTTGGTRRIKGENGSFPVFSPDGRLVASVQDLPDQQTGGYSVPSVVVVRKNGHRVRKVSIGDNLGTIQFGAVTWRPKR